MDIDDAVKYCDLMLELKCRINAVNALATGSVSLGYLPINVESIYLQYRKVLELIAFGSLVANKDRYAEARANFSSDWHAERVLKQIERINPDFYPEPILQTPVEGGDFCAKFEKFHGDYLTRESFSILYDKCGDILHSENPYGDQYDYTEFMDQAVAWGVKIRNLLNAHSIRLVDDEKFYLIQMGGQSQKPSYTLFEMME